MTLLSLDQIKSEVQRLASRIDASSDVLPTFGHSRDGGYLHIEVDAAGYHYVVKERGQELKRITTTDLDELLYLVFDSVTFELATRYERQHREAGKDSRRLYFRKQVDLLRVLSPHWAERRAQQLEAILAKYPFDDAALARSSLTVELRKHRRTSDEAYKLACQRYHLPPGRDR